MEAVRHDLNKIDEANMVVGARVELNEIELNMIYCIVLEA